MSDTFVYDTSANVKSVDPVIQGRMDRYPSQDDPEYWSKVPALFEEEFDSEEKISLFKTNWITYRVPICISEFTPVELGYVNAAVKSIIKTYKDEEKDKWLSLFTESKLGHSEDSYRTLTKQVKLKDDVNERVLENVSPLRAMKVHHAYSYYQSTGKTFQDYDVIVEVGGGIGEFARLIRDLGFEGDYYDIDFKPMCDIVNYYTEFNEKNHFVRHANELPSFDGKKVLVIGTWSFSEVPFSYREEIVNKIGKADWLIAFQCDVFEQDNLNYFIKDFKELVSGDYKFTCLPWHHYQGGNLYCFITQ